MGFFNFFTLPSASRAVEHAVSFDLTTNHPHRNVRSQRAPRALVRMPMEIVLHILEIAYYNDDLESNDRLIADCSLVCRDWAPAAQRLLFRHVTLRTHAASNAFQSAVDRSTAHGRMLGDAVVRMRVVIDHNQPTGISQRSFARAVRLCPNLYELNLALYGYAVPGKDAVDRARRTEPCFDEETLAILASGPSITALQFSNWSDNRQSIIRLLSVWPALRSLAISGTAPALLTDPLQPYPGQLDELRMNFQSSPSVDFMHWLLHCSAGALRILELEREPSTDILDYIVDHHGDQLESLALPTCGSHDQALAVQKCQQLRELKVENPWASPMVYRRLPAVVQHIAFGLGRETALQPVIDTVKSRDDLAVVTAHVWEGGDCHPQLSALKIACTIRGVELRFTRDIRTFRGIIRGDPVPTTSFPRYKAFENLTRMRCCV
ncbi:hypothetical protein PLICRDRAFT_36575 [Plicaturopsis crispa FD-325 SS-3]|nr:hypothetical protein PLICRDRAFT_36575 [Plicaturopsis crispa FD-325 SS-3]